MHNWWQIEWRKLCKGEREYVFPAILKELVGMEFHRPES